MKAIQSVYLLFCLGFALQSCEKEETFSVHLDKDKLPYQSLSEYHFFKGNLKEIEPNNGVLLYEPITPLFTDYAWKKRFVWMPEGTQATVNERGIIEYPDGAALIKNFYYPKDFAKDENDREMVETRVLIKIDGVWNAYTYIWNEQQTDAKLNIVGAVRPVRWKDEKGKMQEISYVVPNKNQCKSCHQTNTVLKPIGTKVKNIQSKIVYSDGTSANQLEKWVEMGYLPKGNYSKFAAVADWSDENADLHARALAYLEANCGHCHSREGQARTSGLYLTTDETERPHLGICKAPVAAGQGSGGRRVSILPSNAHESILWYRMQSLDPGVMMPELGRVMNHTEGIALIEKWINAMSAEDCRQ